MWKRNFVPEIIVILSVSVGLLYSANAAPVNVTQHHNHYTRDGLYIDPAFTYSAASNLTRNVSFNGAIDGNVYAQPLYIEGGPGGEAVVIAVTESNNVYALDAISGNVVWQDNLGPPVPLSDLPCGDINPLGITGTPVVDLTNRTLFVDAMVTTNGGPTEQHFIYSLNVDTGATNAGWPVDVNAAAQFNTTPFTSVSQNQRGALALLDGYVYVPYGGHDGDCSTYHGWIVGIQETNSANVLAWATSANGGGAWGMGGVASDDGIHPYLATGNTFSATGWSGGEAVIRFQPGPVFSGLTNDYWAPTNWLTLDDKDLDLGSSGPLIVNVPGATPSQLIFAFGKDGNAYLLNRTNLSGVSPAVTTLSVGGMARNASVTYQTLLGTYVAVDTGNNEIVALRIGASNPPSLSVAWTQSFSGAGSPFVTSTDGTNNVIVWVIGSEGDQQLHGFNGDTGAVIFNGGGSNQLMANTRRFNTGIVARGRIFVANDNQVYEFSVPVPPFVLGDWTILPGGAFQFGFTNTPGLAFTVYGATNITLPSITNWTPLGAATEISPGQFQFTDESDASKERFYRVTSP